MRVILDLVLNYTSDEHPWFLELQYSKPRQSQIRLVRVGGYSPE